MERALSKILFQKRQWKSFIKVTFIKGLIECAISKLCTGQSYFLRQLGGASIVIHCSMVDQYMSRLVNNKKKTYVGSSKDHFLTFWVFNSLTPTNQDVVRSAGNFHHGLLKIYRLESVTFRFLARTGAPICARAFSDETTTDH